jgi:hypothetical protein
MLASECISAAFREADVTTIGTTPTDAELAEGLALLNGFVTRLFGTEFGENMQDWPLPPQAGQFPNAPGVPDNLVQPIMGDTWYLAPRVNSRLLLKTTSGVTIKFPEAPFDGSQIAIVDVGSNSTEITLSGNGRLIDGQQTLVDTPQAFSGKRYFYRSDIASWQEVEALALDDPLPLVADFDDLFITYLAIRLAPRNAQSTTDETAKVYQDLLKKARTRYRQEQATAVTPDSNISQSIQSYGPTGSDWFG